MSGRREPCCGICPAIHTLQKDAWSPVVRCTKVTGRVRYTEDVMTDVLDFQDYPEIATHGVAGVTIIGSKAWIRMFRWKRIDRLWWPVICAAISRPLEGLYERLPHKTDLARVPFEHKGSRP